MTTIIDASHIPAQGVALIECGKWKIIVRSRESALRCAPFHIRTHITYKRCSVNGVISSITDMHVKKNSSRLAFRRLLAVIGCLSILTFGSYSLSHRYFLQAIVHFDATILQFTAEHPCSQINQTRIEVGRKHFAQSRVIICGMIRDRDAHTPRLQQQLDQITPLFADYAIVIVENDSTDRTRETLIKWAKKDSRVHLLGCNDTNQPCHLSLPATERQFIPKQSRIEKMVRLRNIYMDYIDKHQPFDHFDYVIVEDFDLTTSTFINGLYSSAFHFTEDANIDAICSNGILQRQLVDKWLAYESYFDPYAHKDQQNEHWSMTYNDLWSTLFRRYSCDQDLLRVKSCFSGRTIYRYQQIRDKRYRTYIDEYQQVVCEHVGFHETIKNVYLNGEMIFYVLRNNILQ